MFTLFLIISSLILYSTYARSFLNPVTGHEETFRLTLLLHLAGHVQLQPQPGKRALLQIVLLPYLVRRAQTDSSSRFNQSLEWWGWWWKWQEHWYPLVRVPTLWQKMEESIWWPTVVFPILVSICEGCIDDLERFIFWRGVHGLIYQRIYLSYSNGGGSELSPDWVFLFEWGALLRIQLIDISSHCGGRESISGCGSRKDNLLRNLHCWISLSIIDGSVRIPGS